MDLFSKKEVFFGFIPGLPHLLFGFFVFVVFGVGVGL